MNTKRFLAGELLSPVSNRRCLARVVLHLADAVQILAAKPNSKMVVFLATVICCTIWNSVTAAPIFGGPHTFLQPDGSSVTLILNGDEFYMRAETEEGYTVVRDPKSGWICYATLSGDGQDLISTGVHYLGTNGILLVAQLRTGAGVLPDRHLDLSMDNRLRKARTTKSRLVGEHTALVAPKATARVAAAMPAAVMPINAAPMPSRKSDLSKFSGTIRGIVLVFDFPDALAPASPSFQDVVNSINKPNFYQTNGVANSIRTFYEDISRGTFIVSNFMVGIYRATNTFAYYDQLDYTVGAQLLITQGLEQLKASGFDFGQLSLDDGNNVRGLCVMYTGNPQTWAQGMWFHQGWWGNGPTYNGINFHQYATVPFSANPATAIHEHGHLLAEWHDLYSYNGAPTGAWGIMSQVETELPDPYLLYINGWLDAVNIAGISGWQTMNSLDAHSALVYYDPGQPNEFYFIRPYTRNLLYCSSIPDQGLSLWRVNPLGSNADYPYAPLEVEMIHANGDINNYYSNVLFKAAARNCYTDTTVPGSYWVYPGCKGQRSGMNLTSISDPADSMSFSLSRAIYFYPISMQVGEVGLGVALQVTATSDLSLSYSASGLPPGLTINPVTGLIAGTPSTQGTFNVIVTASSPDGSANVCSFLWLVGNGSVTAPVSSYAFNGDLLDLSGNGNNDTAVGSPQFLNNTIQFNGTNTAVSIARPVADDFTIAFFMRSAVAGAGAGGYQWWGGSGLVDGYVNRGAQDFGVGLLGNKVAFGVGGPGVKSGDVTIQSSRAVTDGQWHHVAVTRSSANGAMAIYIDGLLDGTGTGTTGSKTAANGLRIGSLQTGTNYYNGAMDEVRIYSSVISAEEIYRLSTNRTPQLQSVPNQVATVGNSINLKVQAVGGNNLKFSATGLPAGLSVDPGSGMISGTTTTAGIYDVMVTAASLQGPESTTAFAWCVSPTGSGTGPVAWYPLATNVNDISEFNKNGQVLGAPFFTFTGMQFDGVDDAVQISRSIYGNFTISFFMSSAGTADDGSQWHDGDGLVDGEVSGATDDFGVALTGDHISFGVGSSSGDITIRSTKTVTDRAWHHVAVTRSFATGRIAIYVDGRLDTTGTASSGSKTAPPNLRIGSLQTGIHFFHGGIVQVKLYGRTLSDEEIFCESRAIAPNPGHVISDVHLSAHGAGRLTWNTLPGEFYQVEWAAALGQPFTPLGAPVAVGTAFQATQSIPSTGTNGFYRIRKL